MHQRRKYSLLTPSVTEEELLIQFDPNEEGPLQCMRARDEQPSAPITMVVGGFQHGRTAVQPRSPSPTMAGMVPFDIQRPEFGPMAEFDPQLQSKLDCTLCMAFTFADKEKIGGSIGALDRLGRGSSRGLRGRAFPVLREILEI